MSGCDGSFAFLLGRGGVFEGAFLGKLENEYRTRPRHRAIVTGEPDIPG
jgi:hypothetical protein